MTIEQSILEVVKTLPPDKQAEVLRVAESLKQDPSVNEPRKPGRGLWEHLGVSISAEDIDEVRGEMWKNFPRDDI